MRFLVTGSEGFAGSHLCTYLKDAGHNVYGTNRYSIEALKRSYDGIFHLGASTYPPTSFEEPAEFFFNNAYLTARLIEEAKTRCFMYCSTSEVFGATEERITEDNPLRPQNPYAVSKAAADMYCHERMTNGALNGFITRAFSHVGARRPSRYAYSSDARQIAMIIRGKQEPVLRVGNLKAQRNVMDVRDVVDVYYQLMLKNLNGEMDHGEVFVICGNKVREYGEYVYMMLDLFNVEAKLETDPKLLRPVDILVQNPDSTKLRQYLKWEPSISIEDTMKSLVEYWLGEI
ncbi:MAG: GDP-mannose 4,6-dehydratase [Candidatus Scalindua sp.]